MLISNLIPKNFIFEAGDKRWKISQLLSHTTNTNKNTKKQNKNQVVKIQDDYISLQQFKSLNQRRLARYSAEERAVLDTIIAHSTKHMGCDLSQNQLLFKLKEMYPSVNWYLTKLKTIIRKLRDDKLIFIKFRVADQSVYYPHEYFLDLKVKRKFRHFLPALTEDKLFLGKKTIPISMQFISGSRKIIAPDINIDQRRLGILNIPPLSVSLSVTGSVSRDTMRARTREHTNQIVKNEIPMTPMIKKVSSYLRLTLAGQVKLLCFPEEALEYADIKCKQGKNIHTLNKPFFFFLKMCKDFCEQRDIALDTEKETQHRILLDIPLSASYVDETLPLVTPPEGPKDKKRNWHCKHGCIDCKSGFSLEHSARGAAKELGYSLIKPEQEIPVCVLSCDQPCRVDGKWSDQHKRRMFKGKQFIESMVPSELKDSMMAKFNAQFPPEVAILPF